MADEEKERIPAGNIDDGSDGDSEDDADYVPSGRSCSFEPSRLYSFGCGYSVRINYQGV